MPTDTRAAADKLDNEYHFYARENGDGFSDHDYRGSYEYREEGYRLGEQAYDMPAEDREDWVDVETYAFPECARRLIWAAAEFRIAELAKAERVAA